MEEKPKNKEYVTEWSFSFAELGERIDNFVRTLGMHRVYNSAFMNMLKNEEITSIISALGEDAVDPGKHTLLDALRKLFRLEES